MKVIILCGGIGTRLKEETEFKPKPMVYVGNKPIIWHIMKIYSHFGFNDFILALGYKADYIKEFFLNQKAFTSDFTLNTRTHTSKFYLKKRKEVDRFNITFVDTGLSTLPGDRIQQCSKYIPKKDKYFMVTYGDGVCNINLKKLVSFHKKQKTLGTITGVHPHSKFGLVEVNKNNKVVRFQEKPVLSDWVNGGYMIFNSKAISYFKTGEMEHEALKRMAAKKQLSLYMHSGFWFAVDTHKELDELNKLWQEEKPPWKVW